VSGETGIDILQLQESPNEQSGSDNQNQGKSYLADDQQGTNLTPSMAHAGTAGILVKRGGEIRA
jgi:hypothetical protein